VRNNIPQFIEDAGNICVIKVVNDPIEITDLLRKKMVEETGEFIDNPSLDEACDMIEIVRAFCELNSLSFEEALKTADVKRTNVGGFSRGLFLENVIYNR